jgi:hypothetical protein
MASIARPVAARQAAPPAPDALAEARALINQDKPAAAIERLRPLDGQGRLDVALLLGVAYYHENDHARAIGVPSTPNAKCGPHHRHGVFQQRPAA